MTRVLVVDDEPVLADTIRYNLRREGYEVQVANDGNEALKLATAAAPDLVVLDLMLPGIDGLEVCRQLRRESTVPILMLTAKDDEVDKIVGLEVGADDYMTKPFSMRELLARVRAMLRRSRMQQQAPAADGAQPVRSGDLEADPLERRVTLRGTALQLKPKEFDLLVHLMQQRGRVLTRDQLLERVWGYTFGGDTRTVDVHIRWLREKIEEDPGSPRRLETVRGVGYRFAG
ncbi:MAG: response regulator transcription factor [Chloroflexota bacterium]|nr:response regulator transcription factor [Chloroflexota bacterium]